MHRLPRAARPIVPQAQPLKHYSSTQRCKTKIQTWFAALNLTRSELAQVLCARTVAFAMALSTAARELPPQAAAIRFAHELRLKKGMACARFYRSVMI